MAALEDLIAKVDDERLREQLSEQARRLLNRTEFGLVFQDHLPEAIEVPALEATESDSVRLRGEGVEIYRVLERTSDGRLRLETTGADEAGALGNDHRWVAANQAVVVKDVRDPIYAGLRQLDSHRRGGTKPSHVVIQGENYYALETLLYSHESKVDVIYIDPPYNTGARAWIYNDKFVDSNDRYRHSKWLAFMKRRLDVMTRDVVNV